VNQKRDKKGKAWTKIPIIDTGSARVRAFFYPTNRAQESSARIWIEAFRVDSSVDTCMGVKDCLDLLGDGSDGSFTLRNDNKKQLKCLRGELSGMSTQVKAKCNVWGACVATSGKKPYLLALLGATVGVVKAEVGKPKQGMAPQKETDKRQAMTPKKKWGMATKKETDKRQAMAPKKKWGMAPKKKKADKKQAMAPKKKWGMAPKKETNKRQAKAPKKKWGMAPKKGWTKALLEGRHGKGETNGDIVATCVEPSFEDPESWDCECAEVMITACSGKDLESCIRTLLCLNPNVCLSWKKDHCTGALVAERSQVSSKAALDGTLDGAMQGKCAA